MQFRARQHACVHHGELIPVPPPDANPADERLRDFPFVDLYLGDGYAEIKALPGAHAPRSPLSDTLGADIAALRAQCTDTLATHGDSEFSVLHDGVMYRVTTLFDLRNEPVYFLRRMAATLLDVRQLGLAANILDFVLAAQTRGLILIAGETTSGKTSTAASILSARLRAHGGFAIAVEDPPETTLDGLHGEGRCFQIPATRRNGYYAEQLRSALRTGVGTLLIGEIRDRQTATEAITHSTNGLTVIATIHAKDPIDALSRLLSYAGTHDLSNPNAMLASGVACVIHQTLTRVVTGVRLFFRTLAAIPPDDGAIRAMVRDNTLGELLQIVDRQARRTTWTR